MPLSNQTISKLSDALLPEVINYIYEDERWTLMMQELVPDAVQDKLGNVDEDLLFEISMVIVDKLILKSA